MSDKKTVHYQFETTVIAFEVHEDTADDFERICRDKNVSPARILSFMLESWIAAKPKQQKCFSCGAGSENADPAGGCMKCGASRVFL